MRSSRYVIWQWPVMISEGHEEDRQRNKLLVRRRRRSSCSSRRENVVSCMQFGEWKNTSDCMRLVGKWYFSQVVLRPRASSVHLGSPLWEDSGGRSENFHTSIGHFWIDRRATMEKIVDVISSRRMALHPS